MKSNLKLMTILVALIMMMCSCTSTAPNESQPEQPITVRSEAPTYEISPASESTDPVIQGDSSSSTTNYSPPSVINNSKLMVYFLNVGQADCILLKTDDHAMLIDAGDTGQDSLITDFLSECDVSYLDYLIATHPHADHIGSMAGVINAMDRIGSLLMPDVIHTTVTFEKLLDAIEENNVPVIIPEPGEMFEMGQANIRVLAPNNASYSDINNYSIVLRVEFGQTVFIFSGDAEDVSESEQIRTGMDISADVIKVGHHGSNSSTTEGYLQAVSPRYAVISVGKGNTYGHPHAETISRLNEHGIDYYRTDESGTICIISDGINISISTEREGVNEPDDEISIPSKTIVLYIGNKNSKIFHLDTCKTLPAEKNRVSFDTRSDAIGAGYRACKNCNP